MNVSLIGFLLFYETVPYMKQSEKIPRWKQVLVIVLFSGFLFVPWLIRSMESGEKDLLQTTRMDALERYGFFLEERARDLGIDFVHQRPALDPVLKHIEPQIASVGASVSISDVNGDGLSDIYLTTSDIGEPNALYVQQPDGSFEDLAAEYGLAFLNTEQLGVSMGSVWGDVDNDGDEDLFLYRWGAPSVYENVGGVRFEEVSNEEFPKHVNANTAVWFDVNRDGNLDLFLGGYYHEEVNLFDVESTRLMPDSYEYATNGGLNYLFLGRGDGTFADISDEAGIQSDRRWTLAAASADLNRDQYPDLILANDYGTDQIYLNRNGLEFEEKGEEMGIGFAPKSGMSASVGDLFHSGEYAIYISNISEPGVLMQGNNLWVPAGENDNAPVYRNVAGSMGVERGEWGYGGLLADLNLDGFLDLYLANGYISDEPNTDYWYDYAKVVGGHREIIIDAMNWPAMNGRTFSGYQRNKVWLNSGTGKFREVAAAVGADEIRDSRAVATLDLNRDGSLDLIVANQHQRILVYHNEVRQDQNWVGFELRGDVSNHSAIGAEVWIYWHDNVTANDRVSKKTIHGGNAFSSQGQRALVFGLGQAESVEKVTINWPSGKIQTIQSPETGRYHVITELETETDVESASDSTPPEAS